MSLPVKILIIGNIKKNDSVLLRKKHAGSKPYKETWYSFGCEFSAGDNPADIFISYIKNYIEITISEGKKLFWDEEIKEDHDGIIKHFIYLVYEFYYVSGDIVVPKELEKVEFIKIEKLQNYDVVPPSVKLFRRIGYIVQI